MKHSGPFPAFRLSATLLLPALLAAPYTFANSLIAGGWVPEVHTVAITPTFASVEPGSGGPVEVAILEIDNNLPDFELSLSFSDRYGGSESILEVRLVGVEGMLGTGLADPAAAALTQGGFPGQFIWKAGRQATATLGYKMKVMVTYASTPMDQSLLMVGMPVAY